MVEIVPIFATPFAAVPIAGAGALNPALASLFQRRAAEDCLEDSRSRDPRCLRGREDLFEWPEAAVGQLRSEMLGGVCAAVMAVNAYTGAEFDALRLQARARFVIVRPDGYVPASTVPMASWCALYCVAAPPPSPARPESGCLRLYAVRGARMFMDAANCSLRSPFSGAHHLWRPVPGQMVVFPAPILHEVTANRSPAELVLVTARLRFARDGEALPFPW